MTQLPPQSSDLAAPPPDAPRPISARARRRAWAEPRARSWWLLGIAFVVMGTWISTTHVLRSADDRNLVKHGKLAERARITALFAGEARDRTTTPGKTARPEEQLEFEFEVDPAVGAKKATLLKGRLRNQTTPLRVGDTVRLYYDPSNLNRFTDRTDVSLGQDLIIGAVVVPLGLLLVGLGAFVQRRSCLRIWRDGQAMLASVVDTRQAALAPLSRLVRFTVPDQFENRVFQIVVPARAMPLETGDTFWIVAPENAPGRAVAAQLYH